jgi:Ser/Thr protein kinase RdoA (MazF antagonist)
MKLKQYDNLNRRGKLNRLRKFAIEGCKRFAIDIDKIRYLGEHSNVLYTIKDSSGKSYLMKIARPCDHSFDEIDQSNLFLSLLNSNRDFNGMGIVKGVSGEATIVVDIDGDERVVSLYEKMKGVNLSKRINSKTAYLWGREVAKIHKYSEEISKDRNSFDKLLKWDRVFYWDSEEIFSEKYREFISGDRREIFKKGVKLVEEGLSKLDGIPIIVHGDPHPDNILIDKDNLNLIDYEDCMWANPVQDIAIALWYISRRDNRKVLYNGFREGYISLLEWPVNYSGEIEIFFIGRVLMLANFVIKCEEDDCEESMSYYEQMIRLHLDVIEGRSDPFYP